MYYTKELARVYLNRLPCPHLCCLSTASLPNQYHCPVLLNQIEDVITVLHVQRIMYMYM